MKYLVTLNGNEYEVEVGADSVTLTAERIGASQGCSCPRSCFTSGARLQLRHPLPPLSRHPHRLLYPHPPHRFPAAGQPLRLRCQAISSR